MLMNSPIEHPPHYYRDDGVHGVATMVEDARVKNAEHRAHCYVSVLLTDEDFTRGEKHHRDDNALKGQLAKGAIIRAPDKAVKIRKGRFTDNHKGWESRPRFHNGRDSAYCRKGVKLGLPVPEEGPDKRADTFDRQPTYYGCQPPTSKEEREKWLQGVHEHAWAKKKSAAEEDALDKDFADQEINALKDAEKAQGRRKAQTGVRRPLCAPS